MLCPLPTERVLGVQLVYHADTFAAAVNCFECHASRLQICGLAQFSVASQVLA